MSLSAERNQNGKNSENHRHQISPTDLHRKLVNGELHRVHTPRQQELKVGVANWGHHFQLDISCHQTVPSAMWIKQIKLAA